MPDWSPVLNASTEPSTPALRTRAPRSIPRAISLIDPDEIAAAKCFVASTEPLRSAPVPATAPSTSARPAPVAPRNSSAPGRPICNKGPFTESTTSSDRPSKAAATAVAATSDEETASKLDEANARNARAFSCSSNPTESGAATATPSFPLPSACDCFPLTGFELTAKSSFSARVVIGGSTGTPPVATGERLRMMSRRPRSNSTERTSTRFEISALRAATWPSEGESGEGGGISSGSDPFLLSVWVRMGD
mmetsp:Transcript_13153/g.33410  ORF Transcript_13153/g.33410 Transcript_13153/m.33410 type:complete len:250 (+) Transcript_13153:785-1534(+)